MATENRSRNGCWTCRARRKKCDETRPQCSLCVSLEIHCSGYKEKPAWMDGGARERAELVIMKLKVAEAVQRRKARDRGFQIGLISPPSSISLPSPIPSERVDLNIGNDRTVTDKNDHNTFNFTRGALSDATTHDSVNVLPEIDCSPDIATGLVSGSCTDFVCDAHFDFPPTPTSPRLPPLITLQDSDLLVHYLENIYQWQFRSLAIRSPLFSKDLLLWYILRNRPLYLAVLALSASDKSLLCHQNSEDTSLPEDDLIDRHNKAIQEFQISLQEYQFRYNMGQDPDHVHIILCLRMLIYREILRGGTGEWRMHLHAALSILEPLFRSSSREDRNNQITRFESSKMPANVISGSMTGQIMWFHILSSFSSNFVSTELCEQYIILLQTSTSGVDLEKITGCENWVVVSILSVYSLRDWKSRVETAGSLSLWDLMHKADSIRRILEKGIEEPNYGCSDSDSSRPTTSSSTNSTAKNNPLDERCLITVTFAQAALILLDVVVSGAYPGLREIEGKVTLVRDTLEGLTSPTLLPFLAWPICIAGCMAQTQHYSFFAGLADSVEVPRGGVLKNVMKVIQRCWSLREMNGQANVDWSDAMKSLQMDLLFF